MRAVENQLANCLKGFLLAMKTDERTIRIMVTDEEGNIAMYDRRFNIRLFYSVLITYAQTDSH